MDKSIKWKRRRTPLVIAAILGLAGIGVGVTFALFSSQIVGGQSTFQSGTVTLSKTADGFCTLADMKPGDSGTCTLNWSYAGNNAWLAVDLAYTNTAAVSVPTAYGGGSPTPCGLLGQVNVTQTCFNPMTLTINGTPVTLPSPVGASGTITDILLNPTTTPTVNGGTGTVTLGYSLPLTAGNSYQGASAAVTMTVHAVQWKNNNPLVGCTQFVQGCVPPNGWS